MMTEAREVKRGMPKYGSHTEKEGQVLTGAQAIIASLEAEGVDTVFGYPGGQAIRIYDALYDSTKIRHILARHEQGATHMADGYARATGKPGVVIVTSGPGATNTVTGIATAFLDSVPMVVITGQVPHAVIGTDAFQEADIVGITMPVVKHSYLLASIDELATTFREAFYLANTGRPGPVLIDIPSDICSDMIEFHYPDATSMVSYKPTTKPNAKQIRNALDLIEEAEKPLLYAGGGVISADASDELLELAEKLEAPCVSTLIGKGCFPNSHPLSLGPVGMHGSQYANLAMTNCDLLIAIGVRFSDRVTGRLADFAPNAKVIHIDIDPAEIGKNRTPEVPIVADARGALTALLEGIEKRNIQPRSADWMKQVNEWHAMHPFYHPALGEHPHITPEAALDALSAELDPQSSIVVTDVGQHQMFATQHIDRDCPRTFLSSGGAGTMGFGLPAAIGAAIGQPDKTVVCITGDGSYQMCLQEMATAEIQDANVKVVMLNNHALGMVRQWQNLFYNNRFSHTRLNDTPDYVKLADAYGWYGERVVNPEDLIGAYQRILEFDGNAILDVRIPEEENVFPMVAPGAAIDDIIGAVSVGDISNMLTDPERSANE